MAALTVVAAAKFGSGARRARIVLLISGVLTVLGFVWELGGLRVIVFGSHVHVTWRLLHMVFPVAALVGALTLLTALVAIALTFLPPVNRYVREKSASKEAAKGTAAYPPYPAQVW
jgi:hypothetical protein